MPESDHAEPAASGTIPDSPAPSKKSDNTEHRDFANPTINIIGTLSRKASALSMVSREGTPPPLPPRPQARISSLLESTSRPSTSHSTTHAHALTRPSLVSKATTQLSFAASRKDARSGSPSSSEPSRGSKSRTYFGLNFGGGGGETVAADADDGASVRSNARTVDAESGIDAESIIGDVLPGHEKSLLQSIGQKSQDKESESLFAPDPDLERAFDTEFDEVEAMSGENEELVISQWRAKLKHFLILSSAGKPIYSRHGDDQLITNYIGIIQTIISFYQSTDDALKGFTAGDVRFVVISKGPLNLVAITRLPESDAQLRAQLDALYMQILSTLTLPSMEKMFAARANYDLRRPLQGTETLLSALSDGFTQGSPSTLLSALECLKLRKSHRNTINNTLLKTRSENLLYGLIVASGKLVSVVRPKKHSLHPGDLHLIFNMLFEAGSVKAGGGENWIPLCLPGFNNTGFLYMYVSFLNLERPGERVEERPKSRDGRLDEVAILLISANKEGFFELRGMRDELVEQLQRNGSIEVIRQAVGRGRPRCTDIVPGTVLRHFLYKSRGNVQFVMPGFEQGLVGKWERRRLMNLYACLHTAIHAKPTSLKIHHQTSSTYIALAWMTPLFELYAIAPGSTSRQALALAANQVVGWVKREEERVFIIGGAVF